MSDLDAIDQAEVEVILDTVEDVVDRLVELECDPRRSPIGWHAGCPSCNGGRLIITAVSPESGKPEGWDARCAGICTRAAVQTVLRGRQNWWDMPSPSADAGQSMPDAPGTSWGRIDLSAHLDGTHTAQVPELLARTDGVCLLYRGRVHSFHGESESGKSWVALAAAAYVLTAGGRVLMLDYESDAGTVVGRLQALGVERDAIARGFDYRRPEGRPAASPAEAAAWEGLMVQRYDLVILDGVTEALATVGLASTDNDEVTAWLRQIPRFIAAGTGAAVVLVDHVTKGNDTRGRFAIGAQAKMAALDGAAYVVEVVDPIGVGMCGRIALRVAKDRPGGVRPHAGAWRAGDRTQEAAVVVLDSRQPGRTVATVEPWRDRSTGADKGGDDWLPTALMAKVSRALELANAAMSRSGIERSVSGRAEYVRRAIDALIAHGYAAADGPALNGGKPTVRLIKPYCEATDPVQADEAGRTSPPPQNQTSSPSP